MKSIITSVFFLFVFFSISSPVLAGYEKENSVCSKFVEEVEKNSTNYSVIGTNKKCVLSQLAENFEKEAKDSYKRMQEYDGIGSPTYWYNRMNEHLEMNVCLIEAIKHLK